MPNIAMTKQDFRPWNKLTDRFGHEWELVSYPFDYGRKIMARYTPGDPTSMSRVDLEIFEV